LAQVKCTHCHLSFDESVMIIEKEGDKNLYFCCKGCQGVYHLLKSENLDSFYEKLGNQTLSPAEIVTKESKELERFDLEGFKKRYIRETKEGFYEISLIIEGIHCSACVWLNEKVLHKSEGVIEATINYSNNKAKVVWEPDRIKLSEIIEKIRSIGYNAYPYDPKLQEERANRIRNDYYSRILVGVFATMNIMWIAIAQYVGYFSGMEQEHKNILNIAEFILATPTLFYSGWIFFRGAYYGLKNRFINMDFLVASGALLAWLYSIYAMVTQKGEVYFDSVTMIITFVLVGKYLEVLSKKQAVDTLDKIVGSMPTEVSVILEDGSKALVSVENIRPKDIIELKPGERVAVDGVLISGSALFDESSLTGESEPIFKEVGDEIISGSICLDSVVRYEATKEAKDSILSQMGELLSDAITKKPKLEQLANTISGYFSVTILAIAVVTFIFWYLKGGSFENALIIAISVIVIACPCALGLATPMATLVGISKSAKEGILFKEASMLETLAKSSILALDKTGTITEGKPSVVSVKIFDGFEPSKALALVDSSNHPISKGVRKYLLNHYENLTPPKIEDIKSIEAKGVIAKCEGVELIGGNRELINSFGIECNFESENSLFIFAINNRVVAIFELRDNLRLDIKEAISKIEALGIKVVMLTGDNPKSAKRVANEVGIREFYAKLLPQDKANIIKSWQDDGKNVVMAGDGINDAIALARSNIAIAMGSGADIAIEVSDIVLLEDNPKSLLFAFKIARRSFLAVKQNLALSLVYNLLAIPLAVMGYVNPLVSALSMSLSSLVVVGNSMRIKVKR